MRLKKQLNNERVSAEYWLFRDIEYTRKSAHDISGILACKSAAGIRKNLIVSEKTLSVFVESIDGFNT